MVIGVKMGRVEKYPKLDLLLLQLGLSSGEIANERQQHRQAAFNS